MKRIATYAGIFLVAMATLILEILLTRIVSVLAWYHLAFFIISIGMLGMTAGALCVFLYPRAFSKERIARRLAQTSLAFAASVPISLAAVLQAKLLPVTDLASFLSLLTSGAALAVPFVFAGLALTLALTRAGLPPGLSYGVDLCGAATGCVLVIPLMELCDAPSAALLAAGLAALGGVMFSVDKAQRGLRLAGAILGAGLLLFATLNAHRSPPPLRPRFVKGGPEDARSFSYIRWTTYSRVTAGPSSLGAPFHWGLGEKTPPAVFRKWVEQRQLVIDGLAATTMQRAAKSADETAILPWDVTQFAHHLRPHGPAAIIGVGGGRDVISAVQAGHETVLGLELNSAIVALHRDVMPDYSGLSRMPQVKLVKDEARSYLARDASRYTVINMPMIDTWAATGAGAFSLSENGLYTVEAWQVFLSRLHDDGIFTVSRWYVEDAVGETVRLTVLALDTLFRLGKVEPRRHLIMVRGGWAATLLVSAAPWSDADLVTVTQKAEALGLQILLHPQRPAAHPLLDAVVQKTSSAALDDWAGRQPLDFRAPTDERPFFFNLVRPKSWLLGSGVSSQRIAYGGNLQATRTLVYATLASTLMAVLALLVPLLLRRRKLTRLPFGDIAGALGYFALIGLGFMFVELGLLTRLSVFLGHPTLALAVLLAAIILFTGIGSLLSGRIPVETSRWARLFPVLPAALLFIIEPLLRLSMSAAGAATLSLRIAVSVLLIAPPALTMGFGFPIGLRLVRRLPGEAEADANESTLAPWLWGVNGACGVAASGLALACSMA
jgi:spermidine synthase